MNRSRLPASIARTVASAATLLALFIGFVPVHAETWQPPEPAAKERDWLKTDTGEWLWGDLKSLRDKSLQFDSDKFGMQEIDFDEVTEFRSARVLTYRFEKEGVFTGTATIRDGVVAIKTAAGVREFPKNNLIMILEGAQREIDFWSMKASLGLVGRSGNTDQIDLNTAVRIRRVSPRSRWEIKYNANYGKVSGTLLTDNHNLSSVWDMLVKAGFFVTPAAVNLFVDKFQNINLRTTVAAGAGYAIMRGGDVDWSANLGVGYVQTRYASVQALQDDTEGTFSLIPATNLDWDLTGDIELLFDYNVQLALPEPRNSYHHASATISFDIWGDILNLDASLTWDRAESPKARADGSVPKRDDFRSTIGFGIDLE